MTDPVRSVVQGPDPRRLVSSRPAPSSGMPASAPVADARMSHAVPPRTAAAPSQQLVTQDGRFLRPTPSAAAPGASAPSTASTPAAAAPASPAPPGGASPQDSRDAIRAAEDIIQAAFSGPPTAEGRRIAAEAFVMEAQAQRDYLVQQARGMGGRQWSA